MKDILENTQLAPYVTRLHINGYQEAGAEFAADKATVELFSNFVRDSTIVPENDKEFWIALIEEGDEDSIVALVLLLLSNLRKLRLSGTYWFSSADMVRRISEMQNPAALNQLNAVELKESDPNTVGEPGFSQSFSLLPSMKYLSAERIAINPNDTQDPDLRTLIRARKSSISHLWFRDCCIHPDVLLDVFAGSQSLASFTYYACAHTSCEDPPPKQFQEALFANGKNTLKCLRLLVPYSSFMGTLRGFEVLETVKISAQLLLDSSRSNLDQVLLPRTIRSLTLWDGCYGFAILEYRKLIDDFLTPMETLFRTAIQNLPHLRRIDYEFNGRNMAPDRRALVDYFLEALGRPYQCDIQLVLSWKPDGFQVDCAEAEEASGWSWRQT